VTIAAGDLGQVLGEHLDHEEQRVFPLLERHVSRREWRGFLLTERRRRPPRQRPEFLTWLLDDASDQDTAAVWAELPRPARLVYRRLLRPRLRRRTALAASMTSPIPSHPRLDSRLAVPHAMAAELDATLNQVVLTLAWLTGGHPPMTPIVGVSTTA
jgi:hypothetical protein